MGIYSKNDHKCKENKKKVPIEYMSQLNSFAQMDEDGKWTPIVNCPFCKKMLSLDTMASMGVPVTEKAVRDYAKSKKAEESAGAPGA